MQVTNPSNGAAGTSGSSGAVSGNQLDSQLAKAYLFLVGPDKQLRRDALTFLKEKISSSAVSATTKEAIAATLIDYLKKDSADMKEGVVDALGDLLKSNVSNEVKKQIVNGLKTALKDKDHKVVKHALRALWQAAKSGAVGLEVKDLIKDVLVEAKKDSRIAAMAGLILHNITYGGKVSTDDLEKITSSDDSLEASNLEATESLAKSEQVLKLESEALAAELQENATTAFENDYASDDAVLDNLVEERRAQARKDEAIYEERQAARREEARLEAKREEARDFELAQEEKKYEAGIEARRVDIKLADSKLADKIRVAKEVYKRVETFVTEVQPKVQSAITNVDITPDIEGSLRQLESLLILYQKPLAMSAKGVLLLKLALAKLAKGQVTLNLKDRVVQVLSKIRALGVDNLSPKQIELIKLALFEISAKEPALRGLVFRTITEIDIAVSVAKKNQERRQTQAIA